MCGIAGFVYFVGGPGADDSGTLTAMAQAIAHRGPDSWGRTVLSGDRIDDSSPRGTRRLERPGGAAAPVVGLAHRRLSIIDLTDGGHQPMAAAGGESWITYNGELYNYRALRNHLGSTGTPIRTASDTEVLLAMLATHDVQALDHLRGMFAFAWWDDRSRRLVLARDRFGIKPLVYAEIAPGRWAFASEPRALSAAGVSDLTADPGRRVEVRARGAVADDASFWRGLQVVAPGEYVTITARGAARQTYWSLGDRLLGPSAPTTPARAAVVFREALADSVHAHLVSDVPVGLFLSGGLDSAAILATVRDLGAGPIRTFTITMGDDRSGVHDAVDEAVAARETARQFGGEHTELRVGGLDLDATLDEFFAAMPEPTFDGLNTFIVARAARQAGVRVALSGIGGDELLGGYASFRQVPRLSAWLRRLTPVGRAGLAAASGLAGRRADKLRTIAADAPDVVSIWWHYRAVTPEVTFPLDRSRWPDALDRVSPRAAIRYLEWKEYLQRQLLRDADAFTMGRALELRTPLVDHGVLEAVAAVGEWPREGARSFKAALFEAQPELARRGGAAMRKQGFVLPMARWMREALSTAPPRWRDLRPRLERHGHGALAAAFLDGRLHWSRLWAAYVVARMERP